MQEHAVERIDLLEARLHRKFLFGQAFSV